MAKPKRRRISDLFWELVDGEPPTPTPEELEELKNAMLDPEAEVSDNLKYAVKILRRDTERLNAAIEETEEQREARRAKDRERQARHRLSQMSQDVTNVTDVTERDRRDKCDERHETSQASQLSQTSQTVTPVTPTNQRDNQLTNITERWAGITPSHKAVFQPPSLEEVKKRIREMGYHFDAETFVAFYASKGWKVGNQPMKDWKQACATWERREKNGVQTAPRPANLNGAGDRTGKDGRSAYDGLF